MGMVPQRQTAPISVPKMSKVIPLYPPNGEYIALASVIPEAIRERFERIAARRG